MTTCKGIDLQKTFGTDKTLETEGFKYELGDESFIMLAFAGVTNKKYQRLLQAKYKKNRGKIKRGNLDADDDREILADVYSQAVVMGWENLNIGEEPLPYTTDNAKKVLMDYPIFFEEIVQAASDTENFKSASNDEDINDSIEDAKKS